MMWIIFIIVIISLVRRWQLRRYIELSKKIKCGIKAYPLIGHAHLFCGDGEKQMNTLKMFAQEAIANGGKTSCWLGGNFYLLDADDNEVILRKALDKDNVTKIGQSLIKNGSVFAPVHIWRHRRKILIPAFSSRYLNSFMEVFARQSDIMVEQMGAVIDKGVVSLWKYFVTLSLDTVCETTLGVQQKSHLHSEDTFLSSLEKCGKIMGSRFLKPWLYFDVIYHLMPCYTEFEKNKDVLYKFLNKVIQSKCKSLKDDIKGTAKGFKPILDLLIESGYSDTELQEETLTITIAAVDTTAITACFTLWTLARHPDVQKKVVEELLQVFGDSDGPVTRDHLPRLKYLEAVIKESLRLYPAVPIIGRQTDSDLELPSGVTLVKGCSAMISIWGTHRNPVYWGNDAEQFRPERFFEAWPTHSAAFLPFSLGSRSCIGYQYGMMSIKTALASVLRKYRVLSADDDVINGTNNTLKTPRLSYEIMMKAVDGWNVRLEQRKTKTLRK